MSGHPEQVKLRAERSGKGDGRVFRITATISDGSDSGSSDKLRVIVPHDQSAAPAVDSAWWSTPSARKQHDP